MEPVIFLAQFWGGFMVIVGGMLLIGGQKLVRELVEVSKDRGFVVMAGFFALAIGIATVVLHSVWSLDQAGIVTLLGWLAIVGGVIRIMLPKLVHEMIVSIEKHISVVYIAAFFCIGLGTVLLRFGIS